MPLIFIPNIHVCDLVPILHDQLQMNMVYENVVMLIVNIKTIFLT